MADLAAEPMRLRTSYPTRGDPGAPDMGHILRQAPWAKASLRPSAPPFGKGVN